MNEDDRQLEGQYGFARGSMDHGTQSASSVRLVHSQDETDKPSPERPTAFHRPSDEASRSESAEEHWVVRPRKEQAARPKLTPLEMKASDLRMPGMSDGEEPSAASTSGVERTSKRWLALALAGMTYVIGLAGLWSMVQGFEDAMLLPVTPAGDEQTVPPLDGTIDVRDASLDGLIRPKSRPNDLGIPSNVAESNLQNRS